MDTYEAFYMERATLTVTEAGALLGISRTSAYLATRTGQLPTIRVGRRLLVSRARLAALLNEKAAASTESVPVEP
jgi:excisionase family DNA binding protein